MRRAYNGVVFGLLDRSIGLPIQTPVHELVVSTTNIVTPILIGALDEEGNKRILVAVLEAFEELLVSAGSVAVYEDDACDQLADALVYFLEGKVGPSQQQQHTLPNLNPPRQTGSYSITTYYGVFQTRLYVILVNRQVRMMMKMMMMQKMAKLVRSPLRTHE